MAGAGIWLNTMSNNNHVKGNKMYGTSCTGFRITQSSNNLCEKNIVYGVRVGAVVNFASHNILNENKFYDIWEFEAIQMYRSHDNDVVNNLIDNATVGIGLFSSKETSISGNIIKKAGRALFLYDTTNSEVTGNSVEDCLISLTVDNSSGNKLTGNNIISCKDNAFTCDGNEWANNFWEGETAESDKTLDKSPRSVKNSIGSIVPELELINYQPQQNNFVFIENDTVWENKTVILNGALNVAKNASLTMRNVKLIYKPSLYSADHTPFHSEGKLTIENCELIGSEFDKQFLLIVENAESVVIKNSTFRYMGEWGPAVGLINIKSSIIENNIFKDSYGSVMWDKCGTVEFSRNIIDNCNYGLDPKMGYGQVRITDNKFSRCVYHCIKLWYWDDKVKIENNEFTDSWGSGIWSAIAFDHNGISSKLAKNTFNFLHSPSSISAWMYHADLRGLRELSNTTANVKKGEEIKTHVFTNGIHVKKELFGKPLSVNLQLVVNGKVIDQKDGNMTGGTMNYVTLKGVAPEDGIYEVRIGASKAVVKLPDTEPGPKPGSKEKSDVKAKRSNVNVLVNSKKIGFDAFAINGNNYFKLRDLAMALNGSNKQFEVTWDSKANAISLKSKSKYTPVGGELAVAFEPAEAAAAVTESKVLLDGKELALTAYNIGGNNYFKLRDIGKALNFGVTWDGAAGTISIDTTGSYIE